MMRRESVLDKVSRMLRSLSLRSLDFQKAAHGKENPLVHFKRIFLDHDKFEFSFSGMKSQVSFPFRKIKKNLKYFFQNN